uniref:Transcription factor E2F7 n=1 Tax=Monodelphis domestica TaxID=13616 RepID=A0A5F8GIN3_MONDO
MHDKRSLLPRLLHAPSPRPSCASRCSPARPRQKLTRRAPHSPLFPSPASLPLARLTSRRYYYPEGGGERVCYNWAGPEPGRAERSANIPEGAARPQARDWRALPRGSPSGRRPLAGATHSVSRRQNPGGFSGAGVTLDSSRDRRVWAGGRSVRRPEVALAEPGTACSRAPAPCGGRRARPRPPMVKFEAPPQPGSSPASRAPAAPARQEETSLGRRAMEVNCLTLQDLICPRQPRLEFVIEDGENAQKENIFVDRSRLAPKTPMKNEPIDLSKQKTYTPERNPITPVKLADRPQAEPWTPTANLKMLISAASPDMRDREKKKELFRPIENKDDAFSDSLQFDAVGCGTVDEFDKQRPSRKQKSLGLLCQKFLARYPSYPLSTEKTTISLDEVAASLGVERRRIYDIVNVLESLHMVSRVAKNQYGWHGRHGLQKTLKNLQRLGEEQKYEEQMAYFHQKELNLVEPKFGERKREGFLDSQDQPLLDFSEPDCTSASANSRKDKSLRIMSQKFVMLFLVSKTKIVTLDVAAKILIEESQDAADHSKFKTKVRRLYDIANVLTSLVLIKKVHVTEERGRKPAFKWIGPVDFSTETGSDEYCSKIVNLAAACRQKIHKDSQSKGSTSKKAAHSSGKLEPVPPLDSEYCFHPLSQQVFSVASADLSPAGLQNGLDGPVALLPRPASPEPENLKSAVFHSQPLVYVPSASLFMLYGSLQEGPPNPEKGRETPEVAATAASPPELSALPLVSAHKRRPPRAQEPAAKRQSPEGEESPLSLVLPKRVPEPPGADSPRRAAGAEVTLAEEAPRKTPLRGLVTPERGPPLRNANAEKPSKERENVSEENAKDPSQSQYLYVQSAPGLNGFNFLLPAHQAASAVGPSPSQLTSVHVPCMVVPSTALATMPFIYSPAINSPGPSSSPVNFGLSGLRSSAQFLMGTSVVNPKTSKAPSSDPQNPAQSPVHLSPGVSRSQNTVTPDSPICMGHPVTIMKLPQSPGPVTPKSIRPPYYETFFKTPGSLGEPVTWRKIAGSQRSLSSAQRRLQIPSGSTD